MMWIADMLGWAQLRWVTFLAGIELRDWRLCLYALGINVLLDGD